MKQSPPEPLKQALVRLDDSHNQWHQAEESYFDPNEFRVALNACIQTLRNVTFVLQKNKYNIPGFEQWYAGWQEKMGADPVLKWLVEARNRIVKEGDLELRSLLRASIVASYLDPPFLEFSASPKSTSNGVLNELEKKEIPPRLLKDGFLKLERRWVTDSLPEHELLDALTHCYSVLSLLLHDAWIKLDVNAPRPPLTVGILPCMIRSDNERGIWIRLSTGIIEPIQTVVHTKHELATQEEVIARYGVFNTEPPPGDVSTLRKIALEIFLRARIMLQKDGHHGFFVFLILPNNRISLIELLPEDQADKYRLWREVAAHVARTDAVGVITIGEAWLALFSPDHPLRHAAEAPERYETLHLVAISKQGEEFALFATFTRENDRIVLKDTVEQELGNANFLVPVRRIWAR